MIFKLLIHPHVLVTQDELLAMFERQMINRCRVARGWKPLKPFHILEEWWP
jgi:hypothetical protein